VAEYLGPAYLKNAFTAGTWHRGSAVVTVASMGDEPSNAASKALRNVFGLYAEGPPSETRMRAGLTDDFAYEDRRRGLSFPDSDAEAYAKLLTTIWQTGAGGQPRFEHETLAVRGERFAATAVRVDYGNGMVSENIAVFGLDATLSRLQTHVDFDIDDVDGAITELDRLHGQADAS
jgi:hypothetical protein